MTSLIAFGIGVLFILWGSLRMNKDLKTGTTKRNVFAWILSGEASGLGQLIGGIIFIIIGIVTMVVQ